MFSSLTSRLTRPMPAATPALLRTFSPACTQLEERALMSAGVLDPTFGAAGQVTLAMAPINGVVQADGKLVVVVAAHSALPANLSQFAVMRYNADGSLDAKFGTAGKVTVSFGTGAGAKANQAVVQSDGKIVVVGSASTADFFTSTAVVRLNADGSLDTKFGVGGKVTLAPILTNGFAEYGATNNVALTANGRIIVSGTTTDSTGGAFVQHWLTASGSPDKTIGTNGVVTTYVPNFFYLFPTGIQTFKDGSLMVSAFYDNYDNGSIPTILARYRADGSLDTSFGSNGLLYAVGDNFATQSDGKFLTTGWTNMGVDGFTFAGPGDFVFRRFNADGTPDTAFGTGGTVRTHFALERADAGWVAVQADGKIMVGGGIRNLTDGLGNPLPLQPFHSGLALVRYNSDGSLDDDFGIHGRALPEAPSNNPSTGYEIMAIQPDGNILIGGGPTLYRVLAASSRTHYLAVGADAGGGPRVKVYDSLTHQLKFDFFAFAPTFTGGVRVATGDVTGDGVDDIVCAAGSGGGPHVRVFDGVTGKLVREFMAYDPKFTGGVYVAVGDVNGDGKAEIITGAGKGGGPLVKIFDGGTGTLLDEFMAYGATFTGGVRVAAGDVTGDGLADVITGAGPGGGPHVRVFDETRVHPTWSLLATSQLRVEVFGTYAFDASYTGGVFVAAGDVNKDGKAEVIASQGSGAGARVRIFRGSDAQLVGDVAPFTGTTTDGVRVATVSAPGGGDVVVVGTGKGAAKTRTLMNGTFSTLNDLPVFDPAFQGGVFVG